MKREDIIKEIVKYNAKEFSMDTIYKVVKNNEWDRKTLLSLPNLTLHIIWRSLRNGNG